MDSDTSERYYGEHQLPCLQLISCSVVEVPYTLSISAVSYKDKPVSCNSRLACMVMHGSGYRAIGQIANHRRLATSISKPNWYGCIDPSQRDLVPPFASCRQDAPQPYPRWSYPRNFKSHA